MRPWLVSAFAMLLATTALPAVASPSVGECLAKSEEGQRRRNRGELLGARERFLSCSEDPCPAVVKSQCASWARDIDGLLPTVVFAAQDVDGADMVDVQVSADGRTLSKRLDGMPVPLDPGVHDLIFVSGERRMATKVVVRIGEKNRIVAVRFGEHTPAAAPVSPPAPDHAASPRRSDLTLPVVLGGIGALGLAGFAWIGLGANADLSALESSPCAAQRRCLSSDIDSVRTRFVVADISLVVGLVAAAAATVVWLRGGRSAPPQTSASWVTRRGSTD